MPFPFMPGGAIVATAILGVTLTIFVWALMVINRAASRAADQVVSGLVSGFRGWSDQHSSPTPRQPTSPAGTDDLIEPAAAIPVTRV